MKEVLSMTLQQLRFFLCAADSENYSKAAERLYVDPSSVSKCISALEKEFDTKLFIRKDSTSQLTDAGKTLRHMGDQLIEQYNVLKDTMFTMHSSRHGDIKIMASTYLTAMLLPYCTEFNKEYSEIRLEFPYLPNYALFEPMTLAEQGECDIGICVTTPNGNYPDSVERLRIGSEEFYIMVPPNHDLAIADVKKIHFSDLATLTFIPTSGVMDMPISAISWDNIFSAVSSRLGKSLNFIKMVAPPKPNAELFILSRKYRTAFFTPKSMASPSTSKDFHPIDIIGTPIEFPVEIVWRRDSENSALRRFVQFVQQHIPQPHSNS